MSEMPQEKRKTTRLENSRKNKMNLKPAEILSLEIRTAGRWQDGTTLINKDRAEVLRHAAEIARQVYIDGDLKSASQTIFEIKVKLN